jgi:hypothetical protein
MPAPSTRGPRNASWYEQLQPSRSRNKPNRSSAVLNRSRTVPNRSRMCQTGPALCQAVPTPSQTVPAPFQTVPAPCQTTNRSSTVAEPFPHRAEPSPHRDGPFPHHAQSFLHRATPFPYCAKPLTHRLKPFPHCAKRFPISRIVPKPDSCWQRIPYDTGHGCGAASPHLHRCVLGAVQEQSGPRHGGATLFRTFNSSCASVPVYPCWMRCKSITLGHGVRFSAQHMEVCSQCTSVSIHTRRIPLSGLTQSTRLTCAVCPFKLRKLALSIL